MLTSLTDVQKGMIRNWLSHHVGQLFWYFKEIHPVDNPQEKVSQIIQEALETPYTDGQYTISSDSTPLKERIDAIKYELNGIIGSPRMSILVNLKIINNPRDTANISKDDFPALVPAIKKEAQLCLQKLERIFSIRVQIPTFAEEIDRQPLLRLEVISAGRFLLWELPPKPVSIHPGVQQDLAVFRH